MLDIFSNWLGDVSFLNPNVLACCACLLGISVFDWIFRIIILVLRSMLGLRS